MPICKNCKSRIDKFNSDRCPICGVEHPFEGVTSDTIEITTQIDVDNLDYKPRKRIIMLILALTLGWLGINWFYLYKKKIGLVYLISSVIFIGLIGFLIGYFVPSLQVWHGILICFGLSYFVSAFIGFVKYITPNYKDGHGDFVI